MVKFVIFLKLKKPLLVKALFNKISFNKTARFRFSFLLLI